MDKNSSKIDEIIQDLENQINGMKKEKIHKQLEKYNLYEKIYSSENTRSDEYPHREPGIYPSLDRYYKIVYFDVSEDELRRLESLSNEVLKCKNIEETSVSNGVRSMLLFIGWIIYLFGFIVFIWLLSEYNGLIALTYLVVTFISGTIFLGFAEIIRLLQLINNKKNL